VSVLAGCASTCDAAGTLTIPARTARPLGLRSPRKRAGSVTLASKSLRLAAGRPGVATLGFTRAAKAALRHRSSLRATLTFKVSGGGGRVSLRQPLALTHSAGLRRVVRSGLRLGGVCSESCNLRGNLQLSRRDARRAGVKAPGSGPVAVADGAVRATPRGGRLTLKVRSAYRRALLRVRGSLRPTLEAFIRGDTGPEEHATRGLTLRR
jgi:hypothetical protein